jgi:hypothetical protein
MRSPSISLLWFLERNAVEDLAETARNENRWEEVYRQCRRGVLKARWAAGSAVS